MKNAIIVLLSFLCVLFLCFALNVFDFKSFDNTDHAVFIKKRIKGVNKANVYKVATIYNKDSTANKNAIKGMDLALSLYNNKGKKIELVKSDKAVDNLSLSREIQKYNDDFSYSAVLGPYSSTFLNTARSLSHFYGMPLISPVTIRYDSLPKLVNDNYVHLYIDLKEITGKILNHIASSKIDNLILVSSAKGSYGDIFITEIERDCVKLNSLKSIERFNYSASLDFSDVISVFKKENKLDDKTAIIFSGNFDDLEKFILITNENAPNAKIYTIDDVDFYAVRNIKKSVKNKIYIPVINFDNKEFEEAYYNMYKEKPDFNAYYGYKTIRVVKSAFEQLDYYTQKAFLDLVKKESLKMQENIVIKDAEYD